MILLNCSAVLCAASLRTQGHAISRDLSRHLSPLYWVVVRAVRRDGAAMLFGPQLRLKHSKAWRNKAQPLPSSPHPGASSPPPPPSLPRAGGVRELWPP